MHVVLMLAVKLNTGSGSAGKSSLVMEELFRCHFAASN